ncbi:MAG: hypothetical protein JRI87_09335 [Deltaproteobacteria bacterium]|nr:hypothetical protein [Deltaproteobacteria bacterium]
MTQSELTTFLEKNKNIDCHMDGEFTYFRNQDLLWYAKDPENCTRITKEVFEKLTQEGLLKEINKGLEVEQITRITGYFTKISQWNKGKRGELNDRVRVDEL